MKIAIIGTVGIPARYGGFETFAEQLVKTLSREFDFTVFCSGREYPEKRRYHNGARLLYIPIKANGIWSVVYDIVSVLRALLFADVLLILGVSGCIVLPLVRLLGCKKTIVNIDGVEWRREKWKGPGKWFLRLSEALAVRFADAVVSDNRVIQDYVLSEYHRRSVFIPYGADHAMRRGHRESTLQGYPFLAAPYACAVARIEPENHPDIVLEAFARPGAMDLVFLGNWDRSPYGVRLRKKYGNLPNLHLLDAEYDRVLLDEVRSGCRLYVHGNGAGGTNPSLIEAMFLGLPIAAYDVPYNRETTQNKALYFSGARALADLARNHKEETLRNVAGELEKIAEENYTWARVAGLYKKLFLQT